MTRMRLVVLLAGLIPAMAAADEALTVAVASNFQVAAKEIAALFSQQQGIDVKVSSGATGLLYAQIVNGAPYDIFLAADVERPQLLEAAGRAQRGSRVTYAIGALALWSADTDTAPRDCRASLLRGDFRKLAIANPATAPYGAAAIEVLLALDIHEAVSSRLVRGENVAQTLHFVATRNATLGLVSAAQLTAKLPVRTACVWHVPGHLHAPIRQQGVVLARSQIPTVAADFMAFLRSSEVAAILERHGYTNPE